MNSKDYLQTQASLIMVGKIAQELDLDGFLLAIQNAETAQGVDPKLRALAKDNMDAIKMLAITMHDYKRVFADSLTILQKSVAGKKIAPFELKKPVVTVAPPDETISVEPGGA